MLANLKAALALLCLFVLTADALQATSVEHSMKKRRQMLYRKRGPPSAKREIQAQTMTVRLAPLDDV
jgi:hypothetical protein